MSDETHSLRQKLINHDVSQCNETDYKPDQLPELAIPYNGSASNYEELNKFNVFKECDNNRKTAVKSELHEREIRLLLFSEEKQRTAQVSCDQSRKAVLVQKIEMEKMASNRLEERTKEELNNIENILHKHLEETSKALQTLRKKEAFLQLRLFYLTAVSHEKKFKEMCEKCMKSLVHIEKCNKNFADVINKRLQPLLTKYDKLLLKTKNQEITANELEIAEELVTSIGMIEKDIICEIQRMQTESAKVINMERKTPVETVPKKVEPIVPIQENIKKDNELETVVEELTQDNGVGFGNDNSVKFYNNVMNFYKMKIDSVKILQGDVNLKKYRSSCQKAINIPLNAISAVNSQHLEDKYDKLYNLICGLQVKIPDGVVSAKEHPQGVDFCLLSMAKKFVGQGDSAVSSNAQAAFPTASIIVSLWKKFEEFGSLFLAYMFKESPFLVPYVIPHVKGQSTEDYFKALGYRIVENAIEKQDMYLKRQAGLMRLYAAVMITESKSSDHKSHPYGIENGWKWLGNILNMEPLPDICATLIFEFLQVAGNEMWRVYGKQFSKILQVIQTDYLKKLSKVDEGGPKTRLEVFLAKVMNEKQIEKPLGLLPCGFW